MRHSIISGKLREVLDSYRVRWRAVHAAVGLVLTLCVLVGGAGAAVLVDRALLGAPKPVRVAFFVVIAGSALYLLLRGVIVPLAKRMSDERTAAGLGSHFPDAAEDLVSGVELSRPQDSAGVSKGLVVEALNQIDERAGAISYRAAVPLVILQRAAAILTVLALCMAAAYLLAPSAVLNGIERLLRPDKDVAFFSYTRLEVSPGNKVVRQGDALQVQVVAKERPVNKAWLDARPARGGSERTGSFTHEIPVVDRHAEWQSGPLTEDLDYRVRAGDAVTPWFSVRTVQAPSLMGKSVRIRLPEYTARPDPITVPAMGSVSVLQGASVVIQVKPVRRGDDPKFACSGVLSGGKENIALAPDASGDLVSPSLSPTASVDYKVLLTDGFGLAARAPDSLNLKLVPDALPAVVIPKPGMDLAVLPNETVTIAVSVQDDYGCRELSLRTRVVRAGSTQAGTPAPAVEEKWNVTPLKPGGPTVLHLDGTLDLSLSDLGLAAGDRIEYQGESSDFADDAVFRKSRSPVYRITVMSYSEHMMAMFNRLKEISREAAMAAARQQAEAEETGKLTDAPQKTDVAGQAAAGQQREAELRRMVEQISREMAATMTEMARNPEAMANLLAEMDRLGREMQQASDQPMKDASQSLGKAGQPGKPGPAGPAGPAGKSPDQQQSLQKAQDAQQKAADDLARLAAELRRLQRRKMLDLLADAAEKLGKEQTENRELTAQTGVALNGRPPAGLPADDRAKLDRVIADQKQIASGVGTLNQDIEKVFRLLTSEQASEAERASDALDKMRTDQAVEGSASVAARLAEGALFSQLPRQASLASSLDDVADILRSSDDMEGLGKQLQEFIKRQKALNAGMEKLVAGDLKGADPSELKPKTPADGSDAGPQGQQPRVVRRGGGNLLNLFVGGGPVGAAAPGAENSGPEAAKAVANRLGGRQAILAQDVTEHSLAMRELFKQFGLFKLETADKLDGAAGEMNLATQDLGTPSPPPALEHGKKALALLEEAAKTLPKDQKQASQQQQNPNQMNMETLLLLAKILGGQKLVNSDTASTDRLQDQAPTPLADRVMGLARRQSRLRFDAGRLVRKLAQQPQAAAVVNVAGKKMDVSRTALEAGNTGQDTRVVQRQVVALLEQLLKDQQGGGGGASAAAAAAMARMAGAGGGGFTGGTNSALAPATLDAGGDDAWTKMRSQFGGKVGAGFDAEYPAEFRGLLNSYFDQVRKETKP